MPTISPGLSVKGLFLISIAVALIETTPQTPGPPPRIPCAGARVLSALKPIENGPPSRMR